MRVRDGAVDTADGPYLGANGAVGGFMVFEADDLDAAIALAARVPAAAPRRRNRGTAGRPVLVSLPPCPRRS